MFYNVISNKGKAPCVGIKDYCDDFIYSISAYKVPIDSQVVMTCSTVCKQNNNQKIEYEKSLYVQHKHSITIL